MGNSLFWNLIKSTNSTQVKIFFIDLLMPNKLTISGGESNLQSPINHISFWEKGEMAYSALKKINELKANNEMEKAKIILSDWIF